MNLLHHVPWPVTHLYVDAADVFAQQSKGKKLSADKNEEDGEQRENTFHGALGMQCPVNQQVNAEAHAQGAHQNTKYRKHLQWQQAEGSKQIKLQVDELP